MLRTKTLLGSLAAMISLAAATNASAALLITEVDSAGSSASYKADWFELTNTGASSVNLTGWTMDDNSFNVANSVKLHDINGAGITIGAGQKIIFLDDESLTSTSTGGDGGAYSNGTSNVIGTTAFDTALKTKFIAAWFGGNAPTGVTFGFFGGNGVGLSTGGDAVSLYDSLGTTQVAVRFGTPGGFVSTSTANGVSTFDNTAGLTGTAPIAGGTNQGVLLSTASAVGVNGVFTSADGEIGSPGVTPVPVPASAWLMLSGIGALGALRRRRKAA